MNYYLKAVGGLLLTLACFAVFAVSLVEIMHIGTCASGGPYAIARECPEGMGKWIAGIFVSIPLGLVGLAIFAFRGDPPSGKKRSSALGLGTFGFGLFFLATALIAAYAQWGPGNTDNGADVGIGIMVAVFALMGVVPIGIAIWSWRLDRSERNAESSITAATTTAPAGQFSAEGLRKLAEMQRARPGGTQATATTAAQAPAVSETPRLTRSGSAVLKSFKYLGESSGDQTLVELELEVSAGGDPPYAVVHKAMIPLGKTKELANGANMRVRVDRQNPASLEIDW